MASDDDGVDHDLATECDWDFEDLLTGHDMDCTGVRGKSFDVRDPCRGVSMSLLSTVAKAINFVAHGMSIRK